MSYSGKRPYQYDKAGKSWEDGAFKNQRGAKATQNDRTFLGMRQTRYHQFVE